MAANPNSVNSIGSHGLKQLDVGVLPNVSNLPIELICSYHGTLNKITAVSVSNRSKRQKV